MNNLKRNTLIALTALFLIVSVIYFTTPGKRIATSGSIILCDNLQTLESEADAIVIGTLEKDFSDYSPYITYNKDGRIDTYYTSLDVKTLKVIKGEDISKIFQLKQHAALIDSPYKYQKDLLTIEDNTILEKGKKYLLFLKKLPTGDYTTVSVYQGKINIDSLDLEEKQIEEQNSKYKELKKEALEKYKSNFSL